MSDPELFAQNLGFFLLFLFGIFVLIKHGDWLMGALMIGIGVILGFGFFIAIIGMIIEIFENNNKSKQK